jgi:hypothetical protein
MEGMSTKPGVTTGSWCTGGQCTSNGGHDYITVQQYRWNWAMHNAPRIDPTSGLCVANCTEIYRRVDASLQQCYSGIVGGGLGLLASIGSPAPDLLQYSQVVLLNFNGLRLAFELPAR